MANILVTGGFGFIGSHLVEALLLDPTNRVHVIDDLSTSPIDVPAYLEVIGHPSRLTYDICTIEQFCLNGKSKVRFDEIYHLASVVGPVGVLKHAGQIASLIVNDTYRVMKLAEDNGSRLVDVSTSEVYGGGRDGYCSEGDSKIITPKVSVRLEYAVAKLASEIALINTSRTKSLKVMIVRPFNVAGPRQSPVGGFVLPRFIGQALAGEPLSVYYDGSAIRAFTHVNDIAKALILVMKSGDVGEVYNAGNPANKTSILALAKAVLKITGSASDIQFVDPKLLFGPLFEEANDKYPDAQRILDLGWKPEIGISEVIQNTYEYLKSNRKA